MKQLYLIRHAKSGWDHAHLDDFDRPLDDRGLRDAPNMAKAFSDRWPAPDLLLSSPAVRAYQTAQFFRHEWNLPWDRFSLRSAIYEASANALLAQIAKTPTEAQTIALVGHNPGLSLLLHELTGKIFELKTACMARISTEGTSFAPVQCELVETQSPRDL